MHGPTRRESLSMVATSRPNAICFSLPQLKTIMACSVIGPLGFNIRIMTDHDDDPELAELYKYDRMSPLWFLNATQTVTAVITKASGGDQELSTVDEALTRVLELELAANAIRLTRPCAD